MKRLFAAVAVAGAFVTALALPLSALAFQTTGGGGTQTQNPYGLWYAGQEACAKEGCHSQIASKPTPHSEMVKDVKTTPSALTPSADSEHWPYLSPLGGVTLRPRDVYLQVGDGQAGFLEYIGFEGSVLASGVKPADDLPLWDPMEYLLGEREWLAPGAKVGNRTYVQSCSACHNLGTTRPSNATYTLANGAQQTTRTPSSVSALSIQCEVCHGTGKTPNGHKKGVPGVVGGTQVLKAQVCGQCHVSGMTPQKNVAGGAFGNPNGYTPDATLSAYFTAYATVESEATFMSWVEKGGTKPRFLPNGANYSLRHSYYNEWLNNKAQFATGQYGHANPTNSSAKTQATNGNTKCLRCHSGLGFLNRIGAKGPSGTRIVATFPTLAEVAANDPGISCQVCHTGHVGMGESGAYDSKRRWASGKEVSCGDCHNWQFETLDQPLQREIIDGQEYSRPAANAISRHPQREVFTGGHGGDDGTGGLWGVAPMEKTMAGIECENCHMPRTHKEGMPADDDGSDHDTRLSHRFHVVEPGDAERYKLRPNGDSCAPSCHKEDASAYTRADMQAWLDQQKQGVAKASATTTGALSAVATGLGLKAWNNFIAVQPKTGPASALSAARWAMLQHAAQNADIVINDASSGIHNPAYALAGLAKAQLWAASTTATLDAALQTGPAASGGFSVTGSLRGAGNTAIPGAEVVLETSTDGATWTRLRTSKPNGSGAFSIPAGRIPGGRQTLRARFTPSPGVDYVSKPIAVAVPVTAATVVPADCATTWLDIPSARVTFAATSGSATYFSLSGATVQSRSPYTGPITVTNEGRTNVHFWSSEGARIEATQTVTVLIDRGSPTIRADLARVYANKAVIHVWGTDRGAGVSSMRYQFGGASKDVAGSSLVVTTLKLGKNTLTVSAKDRAGHTSKRSFPVWVKATPSLTMSPSRTKTVSAGDTVHFSTKATRGKSADGDDIMFVGRPMELQRWQGRKWVTWKKLNSGDGTVSWAKEFASEGTSYWRWRATPDSRSYPANSPVLKVVVK